MLYVDWHVYALAGDLDLDWFTVVLVIEEDCEVLLDLGQLERYESKVDFDLRVPSNLGSPLELDLCEELFELDLVRREPRNI